MYLRIYGRLKEVREMWRDIKKVKLAIEFKEQFIQKYKQVKISTPTFDRYISGRSGYH